MSDASDYEYDSDMDMDDMDGDSSSQNDIQVSTSYENSLNQLIAKHRRVLADRSVSVPALEVGGVIDDFVREVSELFDMSQGFNFDSLSCDVLSYFLNTHIPP